MFYLSIYKLLKYDIFHIEKQLQQRLSYAYNWGQKQNDEWDQYTNFIYNIPNWQAVVEAMRATLEVHPLNKRDFFNYAANRWFNFWSAMAIEQIFSELENVTPSHNHKNRLVDFSLNGIDFDHKTSVYPKGFWQTLFYAQKHEEELLQWLYKNQSQQQRKHLENRLFLIVHAADGEHWKLKAEITWLKTKVENYVKHFSPSQLKQLPLEEDRTALADIIWAVKE